MFSLLAFPALTWAQEGKGDDSLENFAHGVGDSIISIQDLFAAQDDGGQNLMRLIRLVLIVIELVVLAFIAYSVLRRMFYNRSFKKYYIQVSYSVTDEATYEREFKPFKILDNSAQKILITNDDIDYSTSTVYHYKLKDFLMMDEL